MDLIRSPKAWCSLTLSAISRMSRVARRRTASLWVHERQPSSPSWTKRVQDSQAGNAQRAPTHRNALQLRHSYGVPTRARTWDLRIRNPLLYPTELPGHPIADLRFRTADYARSGAKLQLTMCSNLGATTDRTGSTVSTVPHPAPFITEGAVEPQNSAVITAQRLALAAAAEREF